MRRIHTALAAAILAASTLTGAASAPTAHPGAAPPIVAPQVIHLETITLVNAETSDVTTHVFGVADSDLYNLNQTDLVAQLSEIRDLGVTDLRLAVPWLYIQPTATTYDWSQMDNVINTAHSMGFTITGAISGNPAWDGPSSRARPTRPPMRISPPRWPNGTAARSRPTRSGMNPTG